MSVYMKFYIKQKNKRPTISRKPLSYMARSEGFEPSTAWFVARSVHPLNQVLGCFLYIKKWLFQPYSMRSAAIFICHFLAADFPRIPPPIPDQNKPDFPDSLTCWGGC